MLEDVQISKKYMFLQQQKKYVVNRPIRTSAHDAVVFETCIPKLEKYKNGYIYRGIKSWDVLLPAERNIESYTDYKNFQYKWRMDVTKNML